MLRDNGASLFGIERIPCDNQICTLLDLVPASTVFGVFHSVYDGLSKTGNLKPYQCFGGEFLLTLDGIEYFSSKKIHCCHCCHRTPKNGSTTYFHAAVSPVLVAPGRPQVNSLEPETITFNHTLCSLQSTISDNSSIACRIGIRSSITNIPGIGSPHLT